MRSESEQRDEHGRLFSVVVDGVQLYHVELLQTELAELQAEVVELSARLYDREAEAAQWKQYGETQLAKCAVAQERVRVAEAAWAEVIQREQRSDNAHFYDMQRAEAALAAVRELAESEIADAKAGETYHAEINNGGALMAEQARRYAWETVARLAAAEQPEPTTGTRP